MVRALASHQCGLGSNPGVYAICGFSLFFEDNTFLMKASRARLIAGGNMSFFLIPRKADHDSGLNDISGLPFLIFL